MLSSAFVSHLIDVPPIPPPHRSSAPPFGQRVRVAGVFIRHGDDGLSVVFVAMSQRSLSLLQVGRSRDNAPVLRYSAKPFAVAN